MTSNLCKCSREGTFLGLLQLWGETRSVRLFERPASASARSGRNPLRTSTVLSAVSLLNASVWMRSTFKKTNSTTIPSLSIIAPSLPVQTQVCSLVHARKRSQRTGKTVKTNRSLNRPNCLFWGPFTNKREQRCRIHSHWGGCGDCGPLIVPRAREARDWLKASAETEDSDVDFTQRIFTLRNTDLVSLITELRLKENIFRL